MNIKDTGLPCLMPRVKTPRQRYLAKRRNDKLIVAALQIGLLLAFIGLWELAAYLGWIRLSRPARRA